MENFRGLCYITLLGTRILDPGKVATVLHSRLEMMHLRFYTNINLFKYLCPDPGGNKNQKGK